jgi:hypothetical protein
MGHLGPIRPPPHKSHRSHKSHPLPGPNIQISSRRTITSLADTPTRSGSSRTQTPIRSYGVAVGLVSSFVAAVADGTGVGLSAGVAEATGVAEVSGVADVTGVADVSGLADDWGVAETEGIPLGATVGLGTALMFGATVATGAGFAFLSSFSKRPVRLSELCLDTKTVMMRVIPKNIPPRYTVALVRTVVV